MEIGGFDLNKVCANAGNPCKRTDDFIDRSKVKILLCDNDTRSSEEVLTLLSGCSYQVTSVSSPRQAIDVLNAEAQDIDIILAEVGMKMLKYIARKKDLHRIPVIMMSAHDEVSIVIKCLRLGAAEYLIKPLRSNELLNLWTHMWRRRHMLGLTEKNMKNHNSDLVASDPGDGNGNTASTAFFSDDTEDKSNRSTNPEIGMSIQQQNESTAAAAPEEPPGAHASEYGPDVPGTSDRQTRHRSSGPKKSGLRIGESSAFFSYVKTTMQKSNLQGIPRVQNNAATQLRMEDMHQTCPYTVHNLKTHGNGEPGFFDHLLMPSSAPLYPKNHQDPQNHASATMIARYNDISHRPPDANGMTYFPYHPMTVCLQPGQMSSAHSRPSFGSSSSSKAKLNIVDRRAEALMRFRKKRKERCFDKKIRYVNRKQLAERRPRVRGQFVKKLNGVNVHLNGQPASIKYDEEEEEDDEKENNVRDSSPEDA